MQSLINEIQKISMNKKIPDLKSGMTVKVSQKVKEGDKERVQAFEGVILSVSSGTGVEKSFTVRKIVDHIGVEKIFPFYSPTITKIEVKKVGKVRRAKLYYMRKLQGKASRLKDLGVKLSQEEILDREKAIDELAAKKAQEEAAAANPKIEA
ncbi:MAG: 50S ribosomal protein L19, large subunit ribosomal protein L19 [Candidatus Peregrinibacteria bacterium GW2011_GWC2_39_14]|nr:MAG: 50S ribosomal protein L19 [Candidatus Peregrinibacteria bacterium GW2011_GWA2_38_36]KKR05150.1 MAG: 50S ribosomal protein L19, large subunit ribosomal protein L19 [Candidatus Peregrinibacteria bacterium GW2011_GWC2_39_14]